MATKVQIELTLDEKGAVSGLKRVEGALDSTGKKGQDSFRRQSDEMRRANDSAQLLGNTLGIQLPRELNKLLAQSRVVGTALSAAFSVTAILAFGAAIGKIITDVDSLKHRIDELGLSIGAIFSGTLRESLRRGVDRQILAPVEDQVAELQARARMAGLSGIPLISAQGQEAQRAIDVFRRQQLQGIQERFGLSSDRGVALAGRVESMVEEMRRQAGIITGTQTQVAFGDLQQKQRQQIAGLARAQEQAAQDTARAAEVAGRQQLQNDERYYTEAARQGEEFTDKMKQYFLELNRAHEQMIETIAGQFEQLFSGNIGQSILNQAKRWGSRLLAELVVGFGGGSAAAGVPATNPAGIGVGGIGSVLFGGGGFGGGGFGGFGGTGGFGGIGTPPFLPSGSFASGGDFGGGVSVASSPDLLPGSVSLTVARASSGSGAGSLLQRLAGGSILAGLLGGKALGGTAGLIGGGLLGLVAATQMGSAGAFGALNSFGAPLSSALGLTATAGIIGGGAGGLLGFGVGSRFGTGAGIGAGVGSGALTGFLVGGPIGGLIGGIAGLLGGIFGGISGGSKRRRQAEEYARAQIAEIDKVVAAYRGFQLDYPGAMGQLDQMRLASQEQLEKLKGEGRKVYERTLTPQFDRARRQIDDVQSERARRSGLLFGPPQFHDGGRVMGWRMGNGEVAAILQEGEYVVNRRAAAANSDALEAMNAMNSGGGASGGGIIVMGPLVQAARVDENWLRNGGAQQLKYELQRLALEGR